MDVENDHPYAVSAEQPAQAGEDTRADEAGEVDGRSGDEPRSYEYISVSWFGSSDSGKTQRYAVKSNTGGYDLGTIKWHGRWRQYAFFPNEQTLYSRGCLRDIADFIESLR